MKMTTIFNSPTTSASVSSAESRAPPMWSGCTGERDLVASLAVVVVPEPEGRRAALRGRGLPCGGGGGVAGGERLGAGASVAGVRGRDLWLNAAARDARWSPPWRREGVARDRVHSISYGNRFQRWGAGQPDDEAVVLAALGWRGASGRGASVRGERGAPRVGSTLRSATASVRPPAGPNSRTRRTSRGLLFPTAESGELPWYLSWFVRVGA